ncbi:MAG TPA: hypothetical protein VJT49_11115 [Amycolatopsis sp.]|uniref:hypothetical protein n=1 Tax=Amycolatopsis sp. TaxID=37632 RepID=UPI002B49734A|nr:hypothetical protein [Amycolatopsis sp.]HKS45641.1 hypothetical protein [Amycolatopsis sp.]
MRQARVTVLAAVVLTGLTGCANRPNNLETYYDQPGGQPTSVVTSPPATTSGAAPNQAVATTGAANLVADQVTAAVLTAADLPREGVHVAATRPANGACFDQVPAGDPRGASWLYNSGSTFVQQVTGYLDKSAGDVLNQIQCDGQKLTVSVPSATDGVRGWCLGTTCTVLLARGHVLSGLQVTANTTARASDAIRNLASLAAGKLPQS